MAILFKFKHDIETVYGLLTDPNFLVERAMALGDLDAEASVEEIDNGFEIAMTRDMVNDLPDFTKKILGNSQKISLYETWQDKGKTKTAVYANEVIGKPISMSAEIALSTTKQGCSYTFDAKAKIKIPIIGGKLGGLISGKTERQITEECQYLSDYLDD